MPKLLSDEVEQRGKMIDVPYLTQTQLAWLAGVSRQTIWRLPENEKPASLRIGGMPMVERNTAIDWAVQYNTKRLEAR